MSLSNSRVPKLPPPPSDPWISEQVPEETRLIRHPEKSKTLPAFQPPIRQRRPRRSA